MEKLLTPLRFIRIHRSFIVTIDKISSFSNSTVTINYRRITLGRLYKNKVEKSWKQMSRKPILQLYCSHDDLQELDLT